MKTLEQHLEGLCADLRWLYHDGARRTDELVAATIHALHEDGIAESEWNRPAAEQLDELTARIVDAVMQIAATCARAALDEFTLRGELALAVHEELRKCS